MIAGYDYMLVRHQLQHRLFTTVALFLFSLGALMLGTGGAYYAYAAKARSGLDELAVTLNGDILNGSNAVWGPAEDGQPFIGPRTPLVTGPFVSGVDLWEEFGAEEASLTPAESFPRLRIPATAIASRQPYPGELLSATYWGNPLAYEPPAYAQQALVQKFTPTSLSQALPVGSQPAPTRIVAPLLGVDSKVTQLAILDLGDSRVYATPDRVVGHIPESANAGEAASVWFFGHLGSPMMGEGAVFHDLPKIPRLLRGGEDLFVAVESGAKQYLYKITSTQVVHQNDMRLYNTGQATIHLVTCVPALVYDHRLIVTGHLVGVN